MLRYFILCLIEYPQKSSFPFAFYVYLTLVGSSLSLRGCGSYFLRDRFLADSFVLAILTAPLNRTSGSAYVSKADAEVARGGCCSCSGMG